MDPQTLWVRVLRGIYLQDGNFLWTTKGSRASWIWSSVVDGKEIINLDGLWVIDDRKSTSIFRDASIPNKETHRASSLSPDDQIASIKVEELINPDDHTWKASEVRYITSEDETGDILQVLILTLPHPDRFVWPYTKDRGVLARKIYHRFRTTYPPDIPK